MHFTFKAHATWPTFVNGKSLPQNEERVSQEC